MQFHDGTDEIAPGVTVHKIGGHTKGLQCVRVATKRGSVVLASDATHFYQHIDTRRVFRVLYNLGDMVEGYNTLERLAESKAHVIPGHDPLVLARYPVGVAANGGLGRARRPRSRQGVTALGSVVLTGAASGIGAATARRLVASRTARGARGPRRGGARRRSRPSSAPPRRRSRST